MTTFTFPIPVNVLEEIQPYPRDCPSVEIVEEIKATWGDRGPLPAGGYHVVVVVPKLTAHTRDGLHKPVLTYIWRALRLANVLDTPPSTVYVGFEAGDVAEPVATVTMQQIRHPDGTPFVLPNRGAEACAA
ncbi:MAG: hypothetical protein AAGU21_02300 [Solidesulfovibrio sp.]|uniref:hypothetical protein n=1 Tax=Solidesulfovibrio sp. TaxID=2910990 RepID=UPI0031586D70